MGKNRSEVVILLHGLLSSRLVLLPLWRALRRQGYYAHLWRYPTRHSIFTNAHRLKQHLQEFDSQPLNFVTHSMGGLVVRYLLTYHQLHNLNRLVMIAPPNHGSLIMERISRYRVSHLVYGQAARELLPGERGLTSQLGVPNCQFGIIAGGRGDDQGFSAWLPGDNDGTITVKTTWLPQAADFIILPHRHSTIMITPDTISQVIHFLRYGQFSKAVH